MRDSQLFQYLKQFGKASNKFIPQEIKSLSKELLEIFFEYYIKGDGHTYGRNHQGLSATTISIKLRDDLQEIALKMGISAYYKLHNKKGTPFSSPGQKYKKIYRQSADSWVIFFIRKNIHTVLPSLIKRGGYTENWVNFDGQVYCVNVPNHTVYIRRNSIPLWCGNSDPIMNWQIKELENRSILSFSDAHSGPKLGREATVFTCNIKHETCNFTYQDIANAIKQQSDGHLKIGYTIEFFPEEGKYHWSGHRVCNIKYNPQQVKEKGTICPVCHNPLTIGVENRVMDLSYKTLKQEDLLQIKNTSGLTFVYDKDKKRRPFVSLIPLLEVLTETNAGSHSKALREYEHLTSNFATEFDILLKKSLEEIEKISGPLLAKAVRIIRERKVYVDPGYDGVFGIVKIFTDEKAKTEEKAEEKQPSLF